VTTTERPGSYGLGKTLLLTLVVLPLFALPAYLVGHGIVDSVDDDRTNGVLALGPILGIGGPALLSLFVARVWGELPRIAALALGVASGVASAFVLLLAFATYCSATRCVV
jgi:peptidoglycan/LPS O-acetylase OafA/YrhL